MAEIVKFNPEKKPVIPTGAIHALLRTGKKTFFHIKSELWEDAKKEYDVAGNQEAPAVKLYEEYSTAVSSYYEMLTVAMKVADQEVEKSVFERNSEEGKALWDCVYENYKHDHAILFPKIPGK